VTDHARRDHSDRPARAILFTMGFIVGGALLLLWSWNTLATDLFSLPAARFRHALAFEVCLLAICSAYRSASNLLSFS
jgi:uncharacterized membrane protein